MRAGCRVCQSWPPSSGGCEHTSCTQPRCTAAQRCHQLHSAADRRLAVGAPLHSTAQCCTVQHTAAAQPCTQPCTQQQHQLCTHSCTQPVHTSHGRSLVSGPHTAGHSTAAAPSQAAAPHVHTPPPQQATGLPAAPCHMCCAASPAEATSPRLHHTALHCTHSTAAHTPAAAAGHLQGCPLPPPSPPPPPAPPAAALLQAWVVLTLPAADRCAGTPHCCRFKRA